jgi:DNA-binding transcriptional regulator YiaG
MTASKDESSGPGRAKTGRAAAWDARRVRALRSHMGLTQKELAQQLGTRQQTVSDWENNLYTPRGTSTRVLSIVAEQAGFQYEARSGRRETGDMGHGTGDRQ